MVKGGLFSVRASAVCKTANANDSDAASDEF